MLLDALLPYAAKLSLRNLIFQGLFLSLRPSFLMDKTAIDA